MGRQIIELMQVLVDRIEKNGYQQRAREDNAFDLNKRLTEAEGQAKHWRQARQEAHEAGELMKAEIETLRKELDAARSEIEAQRKAMADDSGRLRKAEERVWPGIGSACDPAKAMADEILGLREQLKAADAAVTLQRAGIERQSVCISKVRVAQNNYQWPASWIEITAALAELDGEPTPVAEPLDAEGGACPGT